MERVWISIAVYLLAASASTVCSVVTGPHLNNSAPRTQYFDVGKEVNISCSNKTWDDFIHSIWKINTTGVHCRVTESIEHPSLNNCTEGKKLFRMTKGEVYLNIPHFSIRDEGMYNCEVVYRGEAASAAITVIARVPPLLSTRIEHIGGQWFAVCSAVGGKPEARLTWKEMWSSPEVRSTPSPDGTVTVESWMHLPDDVTKGNLTCVASHPSWAHQNSTTLDLSNRPGTDNLTDIGTSLIIGVTVFILLIVTSAVITSCVFRKHVSKLSSVISLCCKSDVPSSTEGKQAQEVEEVEPYESYVQRVNSIYNSSADLFGV